MDIWIVLESLQDGNEVYTSAHLTKKGAYIKAWKGLIDGYHDAFGFDYDDVKIFDEEQQRFFRNLVDTNDLSEVEQLQLESRFLDMSCLISDALNWELEVSINKTKAEP